VSHSSESFIVRLTFSPDLGFFLPHLPASEIRRQLKEKTSVKDVIEACGVPHPEVDLITVNGQPVGFDYVITTEAEIGVYSLVAKPSLFAEKRLQVRRMDKFVSNGHLGKLTRRLRLLGLDVVYDRDADDRSLLERMLGENRALLTRDRRLLMHAIVQHGYYPRSQNPEEQTLEVIRRFNLRSDLSPFTRCLRCNALLTLVSKADVVTQLEPLTRIYYEDFRRCVGCGKIYWAGTHFPKLQAQVAELTSKL
jgi:uncharacterized protein with PIN domain